MSLAAGGLERGRSAGSVREAKAFMQGVPPVSPYPSDSHDLDCRAARTGTGGSFEPGSRRDAEATDGEHDGHFDQHAATQTLR
jgi:hypothetical protein